MARWSGEPDRREREALARMENIDVLSVSVKEIVDRNNCPKCLLGELDTGWECNDCGYDAMPIATQHNRDNGRG